MTLFSIGSFHHGGARCVSCTLIGCRVVGDGSQLADSFENLSMSNSDVCDTSPRLAGSDYENVKLVAAQLGKPVGRTKPMLKNPASGIPPSKCSQIKELWTPPCSPDYRDHTTPYLEPVTSTTGNATSLHSHLLTPCHSLHCCRLASHF